MSITTKQDANTLTIQVRGRFDFSVHNEFRQAAKLTEANVDKVIVDLQQTDYLDSSALGMLLVLRDKTPNHNVEIHNAKSEVKKILEIANFDKLFNIV